MGALAAHICEEATVIAFAENVAVYRPRKGTGVLPAATEIEALEVGQATYAHKAVELMLLEEVKADRLVLLSDMQCYGTPTVGWTDAAALNERTQQYRKRVNPLLRVYSVDLAGYGSAQFPQGDTNTALLAGWSDRIIELIATLERAEDLLREIELRKLLGAPVSSA